MPERLPPVSYELALSDHADVAWQVTRVSVSEALNEPYRAVIDARTEAEHFDTDTLLGCDAALTLVRGHGPARAVCGLVSRIDFLGVGDPHLLLRFYVIPAAAVLRRRVDSRIWQQIDVRELVKQVLGVGLSDYGRELDFAGIERGHALRDYCVQYRESDFDFVSRLLEEEGISYEFIHDAKSKLERLTLRDANAQYAELEGAHGSAELPIITSNPSEADVESIQEFEWTKELGSTSVLRRDFDWRTPRHLLSALDEGADDRGRDRRVYAHGTRRFIEDELEIRAKDQRLASALAARVARGRSNVTAMRPGLRFRVVGHYRMDLEQEYLVTHVRHSGAEVDVSTSGTAGETYMNEFECVPFDAPIRPLAKTPKPREYGPQTAIVTGPESEDIHTDELGRIQVQFYWQEHPSYAADASCWIRCSQSWAGMGWGAQFIPRIGMEVVVEFLEGNPDRPLVTGCVYNSEHMPPFALPDHKTQSGWRTESSPGGGGSNELRFEDAAGDEEIYLHGEKDWTIEIEDDKRETIGHDESFSIGHDQTGQIGNNQTLTVGCNQVETIGLSRTDTVGASAVETVGVAKSVTVGTVLDERIGSNRTTAIGEDHTLSVGGDASETVAGDKSVASNKLTVESADAMTVTSANTYSLEVTDRLTVKGDEKVIVEAAEEMVFKCGDASITLKKDGKIQIKGKDVLVKGSGNVVIKGQEVAEN
ncbi:type VI secretion system Vgr family protein [Enhygromyxa salina]|uniref:Phage-related baseplate assembly protein n=1 Tax=Enhygromyxa salina TaxID=215803 RepID=A0A2S9YVV3_9BACT|nr:type VI secretion system tip protein TssI/VgrG [Enhygromyxa salina]PRQ09213.1 Phage-related baseplate assembly protein [Enhygromyxa salina]